MMHGHVNLLFRLKGKTELHATVSTVRIYVTTNSCHQLFSFPGGTAFPDRNARKPMSQLDVAVRHALIPAVDQIDDQLDHGFLVRGVALGDHQPDGHQGIVGNALGT